MDMYSQLDSNHLPPLTGGCEGQHSPAAACPSTPWQPGWAKPAPCVTRTPTDTGLPADSSRESRAPTLPSMASVTGMLGYIPFLNIICFSESRAHAWLWLHWNHNIITPAARKMVYLQAFILILYLRLVWHSGNAVIVHGMPWSNLNLIDSNKLVVFNLLNDKVAQYYARMNWIGFIVKLQPLVKITRSWLFFSPCYNPNPTKERHFQTMWGGGRHTFFVDCRLGQNLVVIWLYIVDGTIWLSKMEMFKAQTNVGGRHNFL